MSLGAGASNICKSLSRDAIGSATVFSDDPLEKGTWSGVSWYANEFPPFLILFAAHRIVRLRSPACCAELSGGEAAGRIGAADTCISEKRGNRPAAEFSSAAHGPFHRRIRKRRPARQVFRFQADGHGPCLLPLWIALPASAARHG